VSWAAQGASDQEPAPKRITAEAVRKNLKLPGLVINFQERCVDVEATICLDEGMLELIACVKGSKEHESILAIEARPMHIHTALLLLGANNGSPAMSRPVDEQQTRWTHIPPQGDPVSVYLVHRAPDGKVVESPISDFVTRSDEQADEFTPATDGAQEEVEFPHTFVFAGSHLRDNGPGPRQYLADLSGNVISIATFGDELLCLPGIQSRANDELRWRVDARKLPNVGSKVTLRLRPRDKSTPETGGVTEHQPPGDQQDDRK
jgi:hypothetical protein